MIRAVIFDMDGVLIDSEPFWQAAETAAFAGVGLRLTPEMCRETMGLRVDEVVAHWRRRHPWEGASDAGVEEAIVRGVAERIHASGEAIAGAARAMDFFRSRGLRLALASSSPYRLIEAGVERLGLGGAFEEVYSAQDEPLGKPHPGVYLSTAGRLGLDATACLAVEDSLNGVVAAKAARMSCLAVPDRAMRADPRYALADVVLGSLDDLDDAVWDRLRA